MEKHTKLIGIMGGKFVFRRHPDGTVDKSKVMCVLCTKEFAYHRSISSLVYHINAKHPFVGAATTAASSYEANNKEASTREASHSKPLRQLAENMTRTTSPVSDKLTNALAKWIVTNHRPIDIVEDEGLAEVLQTASNDPSYKPPCRTTVTEKISEMYEVEKKIKSGRIEKSSDCVSITGERWSSAGDSSFLGVSVHFIDGDWNLNSFLLTVMTTETSHECADQLLTVVKDWRIENHISTISTETAADARALPYEHMPCSAHALQRSISVCMDSSEFDGVLTTCRKIVEHFNQSPARTAELNQQQAARGKPCEQLLRDEPTRWNSTLKMISRLLQNREAVRAALDQQNHSRRVMPTEAEWEELQRLELLLEPCRYVTELLGGEAHVFCSVVLPALRHLIRVMDTAHDDPAYVVKFKNAFQKELAARLADANNLWLEVATALDPRFKDLKCLPRQKREQVWARLESMLEAAGTRPADDLQPIEEELPEKRRRTVLLLGSDSDSEDDGIQFLELLRYRAEPSIDMADCPLQWWRSHSAAYEKLSALARRYLAPPATCVPSERLFGLAGLEVQKRRAALPPEHVNMLLCLSDWLKHK
ncbi:zinc finger BED domain-containing protein 1 [Oryzias melastigma]|uniref:Zinc finger BED domain-containing protein 1-like n=1 Tax=Oryzias melastigma TaxID=30732 RepID=A0A3B3D920_ORYME|nr:zinc finger BED domain-containing protein 1 [Oryzias melastigma]